MATLQDIRRRIKSVRGTQQITKAMKMVAAAKLRKAQEKMFAMRPYSAKINSMLVNAIGERPLEMHPLLDNNPPKEGENIVTSKEGVIGIIIIASDRGLCGAFNTNIIRTAMDFIDSHSGKEFHLLTIGKKIDRFFRKRDYNIMDSYSDIYDSISYSKMNILARFLTDKFLSGEFSQVLLLFSQFINVIKQNQIVKQIIPIDPASLHLGEEDEQESKGKKSGDIFIVEPNKEELRDALLRRCVTSEIHHAVLESIASEHGARMTAMDLATKNADEMIDKLTLDMNRARQASITREIVEISGGAEAMKQK